VTDPRQREEIASTSLAAQKARAWESDASSALSQFVQSATEAMQVPGVSLAIVQDERIVYAEGFGLRSIDSTEQVTSDTLFMIGSSTKPVTTLMMAMLVTNGSFSWSTPVREILPDFALADPEIARRLEMRHTVCGCTGLAPGDAALFFRFKGISPEQRLSEMSNVRPTTPLGEAFQYSNRMVATGGYAAARTFQNYGTLQEAFEATINRLILEPLQMTNTVLRQEEVHKRSAAKPHAIDIDGKCSLIDPVMETSVDSVAPAGALWSTAQDLAQYLLLELRQGKDQNGLQLLPAAALRRRWRGGIRIDDRSSYGLGLLRSEEQGLEVIGHGGNTFGFSSDMYFLPEKGLGVIVLANLRLASTFLAAIRQKIFEIAFGAPPQADGIVAGASRWAKSAPERLRGYLKTDPHSLAWLEELTGEYYNDELGPVSLTPREDCCWAAFESWGSRLGVHEDPNGDRVLVLTSAPWSGSIQLRVAANRQALTLGTRQAYTFHRL
jgi:CubicO group peptidase (beta-lactamase class C family)